MSKEMRNSNLRKMNMSGMRNKGNSGDHKSFPPFDGLKVETVAALKTMLRPVSYSAGQIVFHEREKSDFVGVVASGVLRIQKTLVDGRYPIVGLLVEGDIFGRVFDGAAEFGIEAATDVRAFAFPHESFEALLKRSPDLDRAVLRNVLNELDRTRDWMIIVSNPKIINRVAGFLFIMCTRFLKVDHLVQFDHSSIEVAIPVNRLDFAHLLGTRPESISRALHALADIGDIEIKAPDRILIRNVDALAAKAGEEEGQSIATLKYLMANKELGL